MQRKQILYHLVFFYITIALIFFSSCTYLGVSTKQQKARLLLETKINLLNPEYVPMRFKILENKNSLIRVAVKFFDSQGNVIHRIEEQLYGNKLKFSFIELKVNEKSLILPYKIFSDKTEQEAGRFLPDFYQKNGFPEILNSKNVDADLHQLLTTVLTKVSLATIDTTDALIEGIKIRTYKNNGYELKQRYKFVTRENGEIMAMKE